MLQTDKRTDGLVDWRTEGAVDSSFSLRLRLRLLLLLSLSASTSLAAISFHSRDVCGRAKMYSFWDVFNFSLKSLSVVVFLRLIRSVSLSSSPYLSLSLSLLR